MQKILLIILSFILICFLIPILFTNRLKYTEEEAEVNGLSTEMYPDIYDYKDYARIKLLRSETGTVEEIALDDYLYGVVASEMPASFEPEALRAQAIVARTYTIYSIIHRDKHVNADICDDFGCCQAWMSKEDRYAKWNEDEREQNWRKIVESVNSTQGKIVTYQGEIIEAFFHANSGGKTEIAINVWGGSNHPYLQSVETAR